MKELTVNITKLEEFITPQAIANFRQKYRGNCLKLAKVFVRDMRRNNYAASMVTFQPLTGYDKYVAINVPNDLNNTTDTFDRHTVIVCGDVILDILQSNFIVPVGKYVRMLEKLNDGIGVDKKRSKLCSRQSDREVVPTSAKDLYDFELGKF